MVLGPADPPGSGLLHRRQGAVVEAYLNRPAVRNALNGQLVGELAAALHEWDADHTVRAVVLAGSGPGFCAGSDLKELAALSGVGMLSHEARTGQMVRTIAAVRVPVIAAVEGFAIGGGFLLAAGCDLVVSATDARWQLPEVELGWVPPWGLQSLVARVGPVVARRLAWGDAPVGGEQLHRLGGVDQTARPGQAVPVAHRLAQRLSRLPAHAVASTKRALHQAVAGDAEQFDARTVRLFGEDSREPATRSRLRGFATGPVGRRG